MIRQFTYVHEVAGISLLSGKNTNATVQFFSVSQKTTTTNLNYQNYVFYMGLAGATSSGSHLCTSKTREVADSAILAIATKLGKCDQMGNWRLI